MIYTRNVTDVICPWRSGFNKLRLLVSYMCTIHIHIMYSLTYVAIGGIWFYLICTHGHFCNSYGGCFGIVLHSLRQTDVIDGWSKLLFTTEGSVKLRFVLCVLFHNYQVNSWSENSFRFLNNNRLSCIKLSNIAVRSNAANNAHATLV